MEVMSAPLPVALPINDASQVGEARRRALAMAGEYGMDETRRGAVAIVVTEMATNLVRHATGGVLVLQWVRTASGEAMEIVAIDRGPGMGDVGRCLQDGYSTGGTPGTGLGAIRRMSDEFDVHSDAGKGTAVVSRISASPRSGKSGVHWGMVCVPATGETECGDAWRVAESQASVNFMVADGLGHGPAAAQASQAMVAVFDENATSAPAGLLETAHRALSGTRGAAGAITRLDLASGAVQFSGIGNIAASLIDSQGNGRGLFSHNGTLGVQVRKIQSFDYTWPDQGLLVMHSDGLQTRWSLGGYPGLQQRHPALIAAVLGRDFKRGHDDLTVLVARRGAAA
jgi:anti-sigma regulatory factor (Ser/Thr protein kinase)